MDTSDFEYDLPQTSIAQEAIEPRDSSRLLVVDGMVDRTFCDLPDILKAGDLLVVNRTRVRHARLLGKRTETGGAVELLLLRPVAGSRWEGLIRPARRMRPGVEIDFGPISATVLTEPDQGRVKVDLRAEIPIDDAIAAVGTMPLPPYFHGELADPERYQTVFARVTGSAAAPTAALHFTKELVSRLQGGEVQLAEVELEVGLDTFRPMLDGDLDDHIIHSESYTVPIAAAAAVIRTREAGGRIVAVGTTVMRTLESAAGPDGVIAGPGVSSLFIRPGYQPRVVDALITNFHASRTTLTVLVAALLGSSWRDVYATALERGYRFLSFGDAMLIENLRSP